jgi:Putative T7SS secretion signal domain
MAELGETNDPTRLVPGDPAAVSATVKALRTRADALEEAGVGLKRINTVDGWSGPAGDAFRAKFQGQPGSWLQAADSFYKAAGALESYSTTLTWAQSEAARAISQWNAAQGATQQAQAQYQHYQQQGGTDPFQDPGEAGRTSARNLLNTARSDLKDAGDDVAKVIGSERDRAPEKSSFWSTVKDVASDVGAGLENAGGQIVNALASFGNAAIHHPGDFAATVGGTALAAAGLTGELGGFVLDATMVGAPAGVVVNAVSAAGVVGGGTIAYAGAKDLIMHATSDDQVSPASTDRTGASGADSGITGDGGEMIGSKGTQLTSKTMWRQGSYRIDVENPNPGQRPGQIHFQDKVTRTKYMYNFETGEFDGMPNSLKRELAKKFPGYLDGIAKGKSALGE